MMMMSNKKWKRINIGMSYEGLSSVKMKPFAVPAGYEDFVSSKEVLLNEINRDLPRKDGLDNGLVHVRMYSLAVQSFLKQQAKMSPLQLKAIEIEAMKHVFEDVQMQTQQLSSGFRWEGEPLSFSLAIPNSDSQLSHLPSVCMFSAVNYNDSIEDEWFIVYVLLELTKRLKQHNLCIQVIDSDGEFLLIESADYLDSWIAPETSINRVWIKDGALHIISPDAYNSTKGEFSISSALAYLLDPTTAKNSIVSKSIQRIIAARTTAVFPEKVEFLHHNVVCLLPHWAAYLIQKYPSLLAKATYAFFNTEVELLSKAVNKKSTTSIPPITQQHQQLVAVVLPWTKAQYAQVTFKKFKVPRRFHDLMRQAATANSTKVNHAFDLGCRVLCGIELVYQAAAESRQMQSQLRNLLRERQQQFVVTNPSLASIITSDSSKIIVTTNEQDASDVNKLAEYLHALLLNDADRIDTLLSSCPTITTEENSETAAFKSIIDGTMSSDSEQWLYMEPDDFDKLIKETVERTRGSAPSAAGDTTESTNTAETISTADKECTEMKHLQSMVDGFKQFLAGTSEISGIESNIQSTSTQQQPQSAEINWEEDINIDMSYLETTLQNAKLDVASAEAGAAEATVNSVALKVMAGEKQNDNDLQTDSDDEDNDNDDSDDDEDDENGMFGPSSIAVDEDSDDQDEEEDFEGDLEDDEEDFNMKDFQDAMDEEIYDEAALLNTFSNLTKLSEAMSSSGDGGTTRLPMDMDGDDADAHFLANLLDAQTEGLGVPMGAFHQLFAQMGIQLPKPPPVHEAKQSSVLA